jgi:FAD/FMN-containing dehydrogenase/Fe-S oxidoreductase
MQTQKIPDRKTRAAISSRALERELRRHVRGEIQFDVGSRALYATDGSNYRQTPIGVVIPETVKDFTAAIRLCSGYGVPITSRGCGTSLAGQCCNVAVIVDASKHLNRVLQIDVANRRATVEPGCILDTLRDAALLHGLTFGPDPSTHTHCTLGGMLGNDSCGAHSLLSAHHGLGMRVADNTHELEILTYDGERMRVGPTDENHLCEIISAGGRRGEIYRQLAELRDKYGEEIRRRFPKIPRRVSGYNLPQLLPENGFNIARALVGSEGTCVTILEATLLLVPAPKSRSLLVLGYPDVYSAGDDVPEIVRHKPIALEGIDDLLISYMKKKGLHPDDVRYLPEGGGWLMVEFGGENKQEADARALEMMASLRKRPNPPTMKLYDDLRQEAKLWEIRESGLGATAFVPGLPDAWPGWEDSAVPPENVGPYLRELRGLFHKFGYEASLYGHFGQGCIHCRIPFDLVTTEGLKKYHGFLEEAADLVVRHGGSFSGEHGDGQARAELLPKMFGDTLIQAFREFKAIWDPRNRMNPGKVIDANPILSDLRLGADYAPWKPDTHFQFPDDDGDFSRAALRCVGVGECRRLEGGTMCPSFMVTREEKHSTRGRAHLLFEMLRGDTIGSHGWRDHAVKDALDLCLACKGCKGDCPVNVDMATYKAEFLSHYYAGHLRPRTAYAMGLIYWWARLASHVPNLVNFISSTPPLSMLFKALGGIAPKRKVPTFAARTFRDWFAARPPRPRHGRPVLLWVDTFNNFFFPETAQAAVEVLEIAGFDVAIPRRILCCGRPLYDYGMLDTAKRLLRQTLDVLRDDIHSGTPIVGLEPSCVAVFRDELSNLFPHDEDAQRLTQQAFLLSEFLNRHAPGYTPPHLSGRALVHGHCHHKAIMKMTDEESILRKMGLDIVTPESGCCGMAGSFGFESDKYDVSVKCGERVLLPAVRETGRDELVIADGFSCREQIGQLSGRRAYHLAEVLRFALQENHLPPDIDAFAPPGKPRATLRPLEWLLLGLGAVAGISLLARVFRKGTNGGINGCFASRSSARALNSAKCAMDGIFSGNRKGSLRGIWR